MTNEEAIKRIVDHMTTHKMNEPRAIKISIALQMAIEALKKQTPKKPSGSFDDETYGRAWVCECTGVIDEYQEFCPSCGQAIDWSKE